TDCVFRNNTNITTYSQAKGGAVHAFLGGEVVFQRTLFENNSANAGGAVYIEYSGQASLAQFQDCCFSSNTSATNGGGVAYDMNIAAFFYSCTFSGNSCANKGGGIYAFNSAPLLDHCTLTLNSASSQYGGCTLASLICSVVAQNFAPL